MQTSNPWKLFTMIIASFAIVVIGYTVISHGFNVFLYPDPNASDLLYVAAGVDLVWFEIFVLVITLAVIAGWLMVYYSDRTAKGLQVKKSIWLNFYALLSRELLVMDIYNWVAKRIFALAQKLNTLLRWN
jgi:NADH-quinone oxidoreductase subunit L